MDGVHGSALVSYSAGISACEKGEQWQRALALLSEMWAAKLEPGVVQSILLGAVRARLAFESAWVGAALDTRVR